MDSYVKKVLTVIACALVWLSVKDFVIPYAVANDIISVRVVELRLASGTRPIPVRVEGALKCQ